MSTIFSKIAAGEIPSYRIASDERHYAFLDINPVAPGHVLVIPRKEEDYIFNLSDDDYSALTLFAKKVARALEAAVPCKRVAVAVIGLEVPHVHIHLVPINKESDMDFHNKKELTSEQMQEIATKVSAKFDEMYKA